MDEKQREDTMKAIALATAQAMETFRREIERFSEQQAQSIPQAQQSSNDANHSLRGENSLAATPHHGVMNHDHAKSVDANLVDGKSAYF